MVRKMDRWAELGAQRYDGRGYRSFLPLTSFPAAVGSGLFAKTEDKLRVRRQR